MKRRTEIVIESERITVVGGDNGREHESHWCETCHTQSRFVKLSDAAALFQVSPAVIFRWAEALCFHLARERSGAHMICVSSLRF